MADHGLEFQAKIFDDITGYHTSVQDCVDLAHEASVKTMLLTHLVPAPSNAVLEAMFFSRITRPKNFSCDVIVGTDGLVAKIAADGGVVLFRVGTGSPAPLSPVFASLLFLVASISLYFYFGSSWASSLLLVVACVIAAANASSGHVRRMDSARNAKRTTVVIVGGGSLLAAAVFLVS